jgi:hypothetical protein
MHSFEREEGKMKPEYPDCNYPNGCQDQFCWECLGKSPVDVSGGMIRDCCACKKVIGCIGFDEKHWTCETQGYRCLYYRVCTIKTIVPKNASSGFCEVCWGKIMQDRVSRGLEPIPYSF